MVNFSSKALASRLAQMKRMKKALDDPGHFERSIQLHIIKQREMLYEMRRAGVTPRMLHRSGRAGSAVGLLRMPELQAEFLKFMSGPPKRVTSKRAA